MNNQIQLKTNKWERKGIRKDGENYGFYRLLSIKNT